MSELDARLRDEIDDQVAEALDAYLAEQQPRRVRRGWPVVVTVALGVVTTWLAPGAAWAAWLAIAAINVAWLVVVSE
ncbi:hypothetical protein DMA12_21610 [Amycolatopsis balhimycina DSM 5908]|uniref:DUF3040 domain-containing protein n=1 Tax=Amycolatopsis balhimycina DSM 5908 TaxID=1081091 RepID=A0A428WHJ8_AMYBA|nr:hypothetical protein [Amycolatopsis balhimycina]RSM42512.1 hypothetical protein DMA12_21610 [Amycolatopsis balhimycina DSM 5908]